MIPKFRVWDRSRSLWFESDLLVISDGMLYRNWRAFEQDAPLEPDEYILLLATGFRGYMDESFDDDEEKEVFKHDVITIFWEEHPMGYYRENYLTGLVDYSSEMACWVLKDCKLEQHGEVIPKEIDGINISKSEVAKEELIEIPLYGLNLDSDNVTILGNIYENPELLEVAE